MELTNALLQAGTRILDFAGAQVAANWVQTGSTGTPAIADVAGVGIENGGGVKITQSMTAGGSKHATYYLYNAAGWDFDDGTGPFTLSCIFNEYTARWLSGNSTAVEIMFSSDAAGTFTNYKGMTLFNGTATGVSVHNRNVCSWTLADMTLTGGTINWRSVKNVRLRVNSNGAVEDIVFQGLWYRRRARPLIAVTFDDGFSDITGAAATANALGIPLTAYVIPSLLNQGLYITYANLAAFAAAGNAVAVHGVDTMHDSTDYGLAEMTAQQNWIKRNGYFHEHFAYPGGAFNASAKAVLASLGMKSARTIRGISFTAGPPEQTGTQISYEGLKCNVAGPADWYELNASPMSSVQSLSAIQTALAMCIAKGESFIVYGHKLGGVADTTTWVTSDFNALMTTIAGYVAKGMAEAVTIPRLYDIFHTPSSLNLPRSVTNRRGITA